MIEETTKALKVGWSLGLPCRGKERKRQAQGLELSTNIWSEDQGASVMDLRGLWSLITVKPGCVKNRLNV